MIKERDTWLVSIISIYVLNPTRDELRNLVQTTEICRKTCAPKMTFLDFCEMNRKRIITSYMQRLYCIGEQKIQWLHKAK